jgi:hypothetical protein
MGVSGQFHAPAALAVVIASPVPAWIVGRLCGPIGDLKVVAERQVPASAGNKSPVSNPYPVTLVAYLSCSIYNKLPT